jgi:hypothetical protein
MPFVIVAHDDPAEGTPVRRMSIGGRAACASMLRPGQDIRDSIGLTNRFATALSSLRQSAYGAQLGAQRCTMDAKSPWENEKVTVAWPA